MSEENNLKPVQIQLPEYQSHKKVRAARITAITQSGTTGDTILSFGDLQLFTVVSPEWMKKHEPAEGGYFVMYEDGYESFSPAEPFEAGHTKI